MARSKRSAKAPTVHFVSFDPTKEQKAAIAKWAPRTEDLFDAVANVSEKGYRVSISPDNYNECMMCTIARYEQVDDGLPVILVGRGSNAEKAIRRVMFAFIEVFYEDLPAHSKMVEHDEDF